MRNSCFRKLFGYYWLVVTTRKRLLLCSHYRLFMFYYARWHATDVLPAPIFLTGRWVEELGGVSAPGSQDCFPIGALFEKWWLIIFRLHLVCPFYRSPTFSWRYASLTISLVDHLQKPMIYCSYYGLKYNEQGAG